MYQIFHSLINSKNTSLNSQILTPLIFRYLSRETEILLTDLTASSWLLTTLFWHSVLVLSHTLDKGVYLANFTLFFKLLPFLSYCQTPEYYRLYPWIYATFSLEIQVKFLSAFWANKINIQIWIRSSRLIPISTIFWFLYLRLPRWKN